MKNTSIYQWIKTYKLLLIALVLLFITVVIIQVNYNQNHMHDTHVDEYFTISTIHPSITPDKTAHRALNGPRMFTYMFYPGALVGMINHMGGNLYEDGWKYPGHNYFVQNYKTSSSAIKNNVKDPNLRYFHYYLKLQAIFFMFLSFIPLVFLLWKRQHFIAMFMVASLVGINLLLLEERSVFYIEPLMVSMMNILIWLYLVVMNKKEIGWFWIVFSAFLFALTISLKFSSLFMLVLIAGLIVSKAPSLEKRITSGIFLILCSCCFFYLINLNIFSSKEVFNAALHDYFSNFWQYATGNNAIVVDNYKLSNLKKMVREVFNSLGGLVFVLPIILFYGLRYTPRKLALKWLALIVTVFISVGLIVKQQVYMDRNILPFLTALVLITGLMLDQIFKQYYKDKTKRKKMKPVYFYGILALLVLLPIVGLSKDYFRTVFPNSGNNISREIDAITAKEQRRLMLIDYDVEDNFRTFAAVKELESAALTNGKNFKSFLKTNIENFQSDDVVIVTELGNNKQLTNYLLPKIFNTNKQYGPYFIFYNDAGLNSDFKKIEAAFVNPKTVTLTTDSLVIRPDLVLRDIKLEAGKKLYFKFDYLSANTKDWYGCRFYFHGVPHEEDIALLPEDRIEHGFEGWDFTITEKNTVRYGNAMYVVHEFQPALKKYEEFTFGIFRGCTKSEEIQVKDVIITK